MLLLGRFPCKIVFQVKTLQVPVQLDVLFKWIFPSEFKIFSIQFPRITWLTDAQKSATKIAAEKNFILNCLVSTHKRNIFHSAHKSYLYTIFGHVIIALLSIWTLQIINRMTCRLVFSSQSQDLINFKLNLKQTYTFYNGFCLISPWFMRMNFWDYRKRICYNMKSLRFGRLVNCVHKYYDYIEWMIIEGNVKKQNFQNSKQLMWTTWKYVTLRMSQLVGIQFYLTFVSI